MLLRDLTKLIMSKCFPLPPNGQLAVYSANWFELCSQSPKWTLAKWQMCLKLGLRSKCDILQGWNQTVRTLYAIKIKDVDRFGWVQKRVFWCEFCSPWGSCPQGVWYPVHVKQMFISCLHTHVFLICFWFSSDVPSGLFSVMVHNIWLNDKENIWLLFKK